MGLELFVLDSSNAALDARHRVQQVQRILRSLLLTYARKPGTSSISYEASRLNLPLAGALPRGGYDLTHTVLHRYRDHWSHAVRQRLLETAAMRLVDIIALFAGVLILTNLIVASMRRMTDKSLWHSRSALEGHPLRRGYRTQGDPLSHEDDLSA
jgi:hypothetical protein